ncbi:NAD(P)H-hydrate dehydratase [Atopobacter phocae]|uniref:NAD(P)H-hydrate dehydratase n=1 Tax=Atopobacter phocae TaxID=136492 RepID=UPI0004700DE2|nr:NAD(P)H-hydrate dehydratase [Atopobacter phocae]
MEKKQKRPTLPQWRHRSKQSHKGHYGRLLVIGGSPGMSGSVHLATQAAYRTGSGLVYLLVPQAIRMIAEIKSIETIVRQEPLDCFNGNDEVSSSLIQASQNMDAIVCGPGLVSEAPLLFLEQLAQWIQEVDVPLILDAGLLNVLQYRSAMLCQVKQGIITPHEMEFARLVKRPLKEIQENRLQVAQEVATRFGMIVVLKGHETIVTDGQQVYINTTGNPGMATAGSGDVLAGIIGSLAGQGFSAFEAAQLGVYLHGLSGDFAANKLGEASLIARDLIHYLPEAIQWDQSLQS